MYMKTHAADDDKRDREFEYQERAPGAVALNLLLLRPFDTVYAG